VLPRDEICHEMLKYSICCHVLCCALEVNVTMCYVVLEDDELYGAFVRDTLCRKMVKHNVCCYVIWCAVRWSILPCVLQ
jgi:hypothetical protein